MYTRRLSAPERSFFLFGPRATGKSTWLAQQFPRAKRFDLLRTTEVLRLARDPEIFRNEVLALPRGSWVVVDEIQRMPSLLDEVHSLLFEHKGHAQFVLTGSSARKLKRDGVNLLAGRALQRSFFPLTADEMADDFSLETVLKQGSLPEVVASKKEGVELLEAYVGTYLTEEIKQEALVKNLDSFVRFLDVSALMNGQVLNLSGLARDCGVSRPTVQGYFQVLLDTLIGVSVPAWQPKAKVKEVSHSKFYYFDPGVVRALSGRLRDPLTDIERGNLLETYLLHELRAWINSSQIGGTIHYWRTPSGSEIDFIWSRGKTNVGIEVKASRRWKSEYSRSLNVLKSEKKLNSAFGVYLGDHVVKDQHVRVYPVREFLDLLYHGGVLAAE